MGESSLWSAEIAGGVMLAVASAVVRERDSAPESGANTLSKNLMDVNKRPIGEGGDLNQDGHGKMMLETGGAAKSSSQNRAGTSTGSPFQKSTLLRRTPPTAGPTMSGRDKTEGESTKVKSNNEKNERKLIELKENRAARSVSDEGEKPSEDARNRGSPRSEYFAKLRKSEEEMMKKCSDIIKKMKAATLKQKNISMEIKNGLLELEEALDVMTDIRANWRRVEEVNAREKLKCVECDCKILKDSHQGKPNAEMPPKEPEKEDAGWIKIGSRGRVVSDREEIEENGRTPLAMLSGNAESLPVFSIDKAKPPLQRSTDKRKQKEKAHRKEKKKKEEPLIADVADTPTGILPSGLNYSEKLQGKEDPTGTRGVKGNVNKGRRIRKKRARTGAVLIPVADGEKYEDILKEIRGKVKETTVDVRSVRKTKKGEVLIELDEDGASDQAKAFTQSIQTAVGENKVVKMMVPQSSVEILDLDSFTTSEEVVEAVKALIPTYKGGVEAFLTPANDRQVRMAIVKLEVAAAVNLLAVPRSRIKIGWVNCRMRLRTPVVRCFRCLGYGHRSGECKGPDRSKACYICGKEGHLAATCPKEEAVCILCKDKGQTGESIKHLPGTRSCSVFREALENAKSRRK